MVITWISSLRFMKTISVPMSFKIHFRCGNPPLCSGVIAIPSGLKSHTFIVILAVFAPQPRWGHKPWKGLLQSIQFHLYEDNKSCVVVCPTFVWRQQWHFWDERHCESLEKKQWHCSRRNTGIEWSAADASNSSPPTTSLENRLSTNPESFSATSCKRWALWTRKFNLLQPLTLRKNVTTEDWTYCLSG